MRITFILPNVGMAGGFRVVAIYADRLQRRGHQVTLISTPPRRRSLPELLKSALSDPRKVWDKFVKASTKRAARTYKDISHFDNLDMPLLVIDRHRPVTDNDVPDADIVVATWWETAEWVAKLSPRKGAKAYFIQHYELFDYTPHTRVQATWRLPLRKIVIAKWLVEVAEREYGDRKVRLVPNSVDTDQFHALPRGRQPQPTIGLLYSTAKWKGVDVSLKAFELVAKRVPGLRLVAFGSGTVAEWLPLPSGSAFHYLPAQDLLRDLYASCDVWLCASHVEGFGLPMLEAMACRCPVVATDSGGPADFVKSGYNGYLVPVGDTEALADRLVDVLTCDAEKWRSMSNAALATATRYTWDDATDLMEAALRDVSGEDRPRLS